MRKGKRLRKSRMCLLREDLMDICNGEHVAAMILAQFLYWREVKFEHAELCKIDTLLATGKDDYKKYDTGKIAVSYKTISESIIIKPTTMTVKKYINQLCDLGYLIKSDDDVGTILS